MQNGALTNQERQAFAAREETYIKQLSYYQRVVTHLVHEKQVREATTEADEDEAVLVSATNTFGGVPFDSVMHTVYTKGDSEYGMPHYVRPVDLDSYEAGMPTGVVQREKNLVLRTYLRRKPAKRGEEERFCALGRLKGVRLVPRLVYVDGSGVAAKDFHGKEVGAEGTVLVGAVPKELDEVGHAAWCLQVNVLSHSVPQRHRWLGEGVLVIRIEPESAAHREEWPHLCTDTVRFVVITQPYKQHKKQ